MNKLNVRQRLRIPAKLADFLDELLAKWSLEYRKDVILRILREAHRKHNHAVTQAKYRHRRANQTSVGQRMVKP